VADSKDRLEDPGLAKTALIRELVDLSRFTEGILRTLGSAILAIDASGTVTFVNPAAERLLGLPASRLVHRPADEVLVPRGGGSLMAAPPLADAAGEVDLVLDDGRLVTVEVRLSRQVSDDGPAGVVAILTDHTDLKRAEQEARRKERLASLGELSAGVAHEIRNPLTGIGASAQILRSRLDQDQDMVRLADVILDEVARLDRIVENMLLFARPPQPNLSLEHLQECVERALLLVQEEASERGIAVETDFSPDLARIWIDPDQMVQVALNLFQNAAQAMEGGGTLRVGLRTVSRRPYVRHRPGRRQEDRPRLSEDVPLQDWVELEVADTGHGMAPEAVERIFNPFYTTRTRGTGLGLSITQAIVREHGGMISVSSEVGRGTTILVDLPEDKRRGRRRQGGSA